MLDLAAPKVVVPATIFMLIHAMDNTRQFAAVLVPILSWVIIKFVLKLSITNADLITTALLSALGTPQFPVDSSIEIVLKGFSFLFIFSYLRIALPEYY